MERMVDVVIGFVIGWRHDIGSKNSIFDSQKEILHRGKHFIHFSVPILMGYLYVWGCAIETTYSGSL